MGDYYDSGNVLGLNKPEDDWPEDNDGRPLTEAEIHEQWLEAQWERAERINNAE